MARNSFTLSHTPVRARAGRELLYTVIGVPLAVAGFLTVIALLAAGVPFTVTLIGLPIIATALWWAGVLTRLHRWLARTLLGLQIEVAPAPPAPPGIVGWIRSTLGSAARWRSLVYLLVKFPLAFLTFAVSLAFWGYGVLAFIYPAWWLLVPQQPDNVGITHRGMQLSDEIFLDSWPEAVAVAVAGVVLLLLAPWLVRALVTVDALLMTALLTATEKNQRVRELEQTRAEAVDSSAVRLRRIERDLHDGPQAQLVAVAMRLGMVRDNLAPADGPVDLDRVRELVDTAHRGAKQTLDELRQLARGIHPPILDSGLGPALSTLTAQSAVPVRLHVILPSRPSPAIEAILYFCAAELLANVAKHSGAQQATVDVSGDERRIRLSVGDDGSGGAAAGTGTGLTGLAERIRPVDGHVDIESPIGGPTVVTIDLPASA